MRDVLKNAGCHIGSNLILKHVVLLQDLHFLRGASVTIRLGCVKKNVLKNAGCVKKCRGLLTNVGVC